MWRVSGILFVFLIFAVTAYTRKKEEKSTKRLICSSTLADLELYATSVVLVAGAPHTILAGARLDVTPLGSRLGQVPHTIFAGARPFVTPLG